jgi:putative glutamine amidotransferase
MSRDAPPSRLVESLAMLPDHPFGVAVQWHPEEDAAEDARLFAGLVDAAREHRKAHA